MNTLLACLLIVFEALVLICLPVPVFAAGGGVDAGKLKSDPDRAPYKGAADDASEPEVARKICVVGIAKEGYFPFILIKPDGTTNGFDRRILSLIAYESGFDVKYRPVTWIDLIPNLKTHNIDVIASGMSITEERMAEVNFTNPYLWVSNVLVGREGKNLNVGTALTHNRIGVEKGTAAAVWMENNLIKKGKKSHWFIMNRKPS
jgi:ABC-type amino acid transport substrate-binding protein